MSIICPVCGAENPDNATQCQICGASLLPVAQTLQGTPPTAAPPPMAPDAMAGTAMPPPRAPSAPPEDPYLNTEVLGYVLEERLGAGGMALVYRGRHKLTGQLVAVKILIPELANIDEARERFLVEAKILAQLEHPNIVHLLNFTEISGRFYLIMQYAKGRTLEALIDEEGDIAPRARRYLKPHQVCWIVVEMLKGLGHAHRHNIIHRDIKPANVIVNEEEGTVKVMDFGIAKIAGVSKLTQDGTTLGTVHYMSPEQVQGRKDIDGRADLYSVGITLYEAIRGRPPFDGDTVLEVMQAHLDSPPPPLSGKVVEDGEVLFEVSVSQELEEVIQKALAKDRDDRFATAEEMIEALMATPEMKQAETEARLKAVEASRRRAKQASMLRKVMVWGAGALLVAGAAGAGAWWYMDSEEEEETPVHSPQPKELQKVDGLSGLTLVEREPRPHAVLRLLTKSDPLDPSKGPYLKWHKKYDAPVELEVYAPAENEEVAEQYRSVVERFSRYYRQAYGEDLVQLPLRVVLLDKDHLLSRLIWGAERAGLDKDADPSQWAHYDFKGNLFLPISVWKKEILYWVPLHLCISKTLLNIKNVSRQELSKRADLCAAVSSHFRDRELGSEKGASQKDGKAQSPGKVEKKSATKRTRRRLPRKGRRSRRSRRK